MPHLIELQRRLADQGLVCIGVHTKSAGEKMAAYVKEAGVSFPVALDSEGKTVEAFRADSFPDYYLIDRSGKLRVADLANADLERAVKVLLAEKAPLAAARGAKAVAPLDFSRFNRGKPELPETVGADALFGLFLFGLHGQTKVWAMLDKSKPGADAYDVLWLDRNADGRLHGEDERFRGVKGKFTIGKFKEPESKSVHENFTITWTKDSVRFSMMWRGEKRTFGGYGSERKLYAQFANSPEDAPVYVPGYDRPFEFDQWMCGKLTRGKTTDFKVFIGNRGSNRGAFSAVDDRFMPVGEYVLATLHYVTTNGKKAKYQVKLTERC
jgi:AhpC/TSA family